MSSVREHHQQSVQNQKLLDALPAGFPDWEVTLCFYTALHLVNAWMVRHGYPATQSHYDTEKVLLTSRFDPRSRLAYRTLERDSRTARYNCRDMQAISLLVGPSRAALDQIRTYVLPSIQSDL